MQPHLFALPPLLAAGSSAPGQWHILLEILVVLAAALLLGTLAEQLRQSAIIGYLLAGALVGPNALNLVASADDVELIAELGVSLLLFSIGLEFSLRRLRRIGGVAVIGGTAQVAVTLVLGAAAAAALGLSLPAAVAVGAMLALSSTACVLRVLVNRSAIDSVYGRSAFGVLLLQDIAVIPLVVLVTVLKTGGSAGEVAALLGRTAVYGAGYIAAMWVVVNFVVPKLLRIRSWAKNRELPVLLAIVLAGASAWGAHAVGLSPAIGAFVAGMLLAESPFATQIRSDVGAVRIVLVTLFFASIGMFLDIRWAVMALPAVLAMMTAVIVGKAVITAVVTGPFIRGRGMAAATGMSLAQVGEFAFVLLAIAYVEGDPASSLVSEQTFNFIIATTVGTLFVTPYLVWLAPRAAGLIERIGPTAVSAEAETDRDDPPADGHGRPDLIFLIGFGPAGVRVAQALLGAFKDKIVVVDLNRRNAQAAQQYGLRNYVGDATRAEFLDHLPIRRARDVVITVPDPTAARQIVHHIKALAPQARVLARARYHVYRWELMLAGAEVVIDEEEQVGLRLAAEVRKDFHTPE